MQIASRRLFRSKYFLACVVVSFFEKNPSILTLVRFCSFFKALINFHIVGCDDWSRASSAWCQPSTPLLVLGRLSATFLKQVHMLTGKRSFLPRAEFSSAEKSPRQKVCAESLAPKSPDTLFYTRYLISKIDNNLASIFESLAPLIKNLACEYPIS